MTPGLWDSIDNWLLFTLFMMTNMLRCFVEMMLNIIMNGYMTNVNILLLSAAKFKY